MITLHSPSSSPPLITEDGRYADQPGGHPVRVFSRLDVRLMLEDLYAKLELSARVS